MDCVFCRIVRGEVKAYTVWESADLIAFLDSSPLFPGHCLVSPKQHVETLLDLPDDLSGPLFGAAKLITAAVQQATGSQGTFLAVNNTVSQSVPHLHVHVVPRNRGDGLKGFFWPRNPYRDQEHMTATQKRISEAVAELSRS